MPVRFIELSAKLAQTKLPNYIPVIQKLCKTTRKFKLHFNLLRSILTPPKVHKA